MRGCSTDKGCSTYRLVHFELQIRDAVQRRQQHCVGGEGVDIQRTGNPGVEVEAEAEAEAEADRGRRI